MPVLDTVGTAAHPRSRGEHCPYPAQGRGTLGSSPLARGTHPLVHTDTSHTRLIPARAGNTMGPPTGEVGFTAHPRSRGEHIHALLARAPAVGSSPLARGTLSDLLVGCAASRLIPARAGNTPHLRDSTLTRAAHPRSRGEHLRSWRRLTSSAGSSPLARGTHLLTWGFTPYISKIESLWSQSLHPEYTISSHY